MPEVCGATLRWSAKARPRRSLQRLAPQRLDLRNLAVFEVAARIDLHFQKPLAHDEVRAKYPESIAFEPLAVAPLGRKDVGAGVAERHDRAPRGSQIGPHPARRLQKARRRGFGPRHRVDDRATLAEA